MIPGVSLSSNTTMTTSHKPELSLYAYMVSKTIAKLNLMKTVQKNSYDNYFARLNCIADSFAKIIKGAPCWSCSGLQSEGFAIRLTERSLPGMVTHSTQVYMFNLLEGAEAGGNATLEPHPVTAEHAGHSRGDV